METTEQIPATCINCKSWKAEYTQKKGDCDYHNIITPQGWTCPQFEAKH